MIVIGGAIGAGKSSLARLLGIELNSQVFYESVDDNPILPLFYTASEEEIQTERYPFLSQLHFLDARFKSIKKAIKDKNNILDRSIHEDWYFAKVNKDLGRISELEFNVYEKLLHTLLEEIEALSKKSSTLFIYLRGSFETTLDRINKRGRDYELDKSLIDYYKLLWSGYDEWLFTHYKKSDILVIDIDKYDYVNNISDKNAVLKLINDKLNEKKAM